MDATYKAIDAAVREFQDHLQQWVGERLDGVGEPSFGDSGLRLVPLSVDAGRAPEVGGDFTLMGGWGAGSGGPAANPAVPTSWASLGRVVRLRLEEVVRRSVAGTRELGDDEVPPPQLVPVADMPEALQRWYRDQDAQHPAPGGGVGWPAEQWVVDHDGGAYGRVPHLSWYPGLDLTLRYALLAGADVGVSATPTLAVVAAAVQRERVLSLPGGGVQLPGGLAELVAALVKAPPRGSEDPAAAWAEVTADRPLEVALKLQGDSDALGKRLGGLALGLQVELPVGRGPRLAPASRVLWRTRKKPDSRGA